MVAVIRSSLALASVLFTQVASEHRHTLPAQVDHASAGFLKTVDVSKLRVDLDMAINDALGGDLKSRVGRFEKVRPTLAPLWQSLAKDSNGRIDRRSLNYIVQRYMMSTNHLSIIGLEHVQQANNPSSDVHLMNHAPSFVKDIIEGNSSVSGFSLDDAVAMTVMLEELLAHMGDTLLEKMYSRQKLEITDVIPREKVVKLLEGYLVHWLLSDGTESGETFQQPDEELSNSFDDWDKLAQFVTGKLHGFEANPPAHIRESRWSPLRQEFSFADVSYIVRTVIMTFGDFWRSECVMVRDSLLRMDYTQTGRVKLSDFHGAALNGEWRFSESRDYLRQLGALDESSAMLGPRVIVPNYLQGASNCIVSDRHYRVCCANDCDSIISEIEVAVSWATASADRLFDIVSNITVGLDDQRPKLTSTMKSQLHDIAAGHGGQIPIHGRLFSQWLHYIFPKDCPFPHKAGTVSSMSPMQYGAYMASEREIRKHAGETHNESNGTDENDWMSQWSEDEELLSANLRAPWQMGSAPRWLGMIAMFTVAGGAVWAATQQPPTQHWSNPVRSKEHLV